MSMQVVTGGGVGGGTGVKAGVRGGGRPRTAEQTDPAGPTLPNQPPLFQSPQGFGK